MKHNKIYKKGSDEKRMVANRKTICSYSNREAERLIEDARKIITISGSTIAFNDIKIKELKEKSRRNIEKLSLLL